MTGTRSAHDIFVIESLRPLGSSPSIELAGGDELVVIDLFEYDPVEGQRYEAVVAYNSDTEQYRFLYLHDSVTDTPISGFPQDRTHTGLNPVELLDCVRDELRVEGSRFDAIVVAVETDVDAIWRCGTGSA